MRTYCECCISEQEFSTEKVQANYLLRGTSVTVEITSYKCNKCGSTPWNDQIEKENMNKVYSAYKDKIVHQKPLTVKAGSTIICSKCGNKIQTKSAIKLDFCPYCAEKFNYR